MDILKVKNENGEWVGITAIIGDNGKDGRDGVGVKSIVQKVTSNNDVDPNVIVVTLTDDTTHPFEVRNGSKGSKGDDGYTPQKGIDYFTENDKNEFVDRVIGELPDYATTEYVSKKYLRAEEINDEKYLKDSPIIFYDSTINKPSNVPFWNATIFTQPMIESYHETLEKYLSLYQIAVDDDGNIWRRNINLDIGIDTNSYNIGDWIKITSNNDDINDIINNYTTKKYLIADEINDSKYVKDGSITFYESGATRPSNVPFWSAVIFTWSPQESYYEPLRLPLISNQIAICSDGNIWKRALVIDTDTGIYNVQEAEWTKVTQSSDAVGSLMSEYVNSDVLEERIGHIDIALDFILENQNELIGGDE